MEMRGAQDTAMAEDLTPPLPPLAFCLHRPFIATHCSACSLPLPPDPVHLNPLLYCSAHHSSIHSNQNLHHSSAARLAALLLRNNRTGAADPTRIGGLLTNHAKIIARGDDDEVLQMVKEEGAAMRVSPGNLEEALMCLVLTNAVEVLDEKGTNVGIAVYDWNFSWINHSCSPNACYRFTAMADDDRDDDSRLRIYPAMVDGGGGGAATSDRKRIEGFGPRIIVRSIKGIRKDEEVTIAYTDLLQPKGLRQSELLLNHQFNCCCKRCLATPATYVDRNLQAVYVCGPNGNELISDDNFYKTTEAQKLTDAFDDAVDEYLQLNNPENCCIKLDELLTHGYRTSQTFIKLHQFHRLSLNAYTTLASAYRVHASDLMVNSASESHKAFPMSRASAAYSLLLAVSTHHLFQAEPSLIASAANHWKNAGESLICLSRQLQASSSGTSHKCYQIFQPDGFDDKYLTSEMLAEVSSQLLICIVNLAEKVWRLLTDQQVRHLNEIKNLVDFRVLLMVVSPVPDESGIGDAELDIFHLGFHCLIFGMYLSAVCFGKQAADDVILNTFHNNGIFPSHDDKIS